MTTLSETLIAETREAERLFCGCVFVNPDNAKHDCGWLSPSDFKDERYGKFWGGVVSGADVYVAAMDAGIYSELVEASGEVISSFAYTGFASEISNGRYFLNVSEGMNKLAQAVTKRDKTAAMETITSLAAAMPAGGADLPDIVDVALEFSALIESERRAVKTGIAGLDRATGGFERQTMTIIAARPSMGKTSLAFQMARNAAAAGRKALYFSIEMSRATLWARAVCGSMEIDWRDVLNKNVSAEKMQELHNRSTDLAASYSPNLIIDDASRLTLEDIWQRVARYQPDIVYVDHQGLVTHDEENPVKRAGKVAWGLKQICKEYNLPMVMLQQLNRGVEERDNKRPEMRDLRESGELEEIADNVIFIYRADYYDKTKVPPLVSDTELIISKFRAGARGTAVELKYHTKRQWFYSRGEEILP